MNFRLNIRDLKTPEGILKLVNALSELADVLDVMYTTTAPNGNITARQGRKALYNNAGVYTVWVNTTGGTVWEQMSVQANGAAASTGAGTVLMGSANPANSAGFLKFKLANGTDVFVPYFTDDTP